MSNTNVPKLYRIDLEEVIAEGMPSAYGLSQSDADTLWAAMALPLAERKRAIKSLAAGDKTAEKILADVERRFAYYIEHALMGRYLDRQDACIHSATFRPMFFRGARYGEVSDRDIELLADALAPLAPYDGRPDVWRRGVRDRIKRVLLKLPVVSFDKDREFISVANGIVDVRSGTLTEHHPSFHNLAQAADYNYDPDAACPEWERSVRLYLNAEDARELQKIFFYILAGMTEAQVAFFFVGLGENGKSTVIRVLISLLGEANVSHLRPDQLSSRFNAGELMGKLLNVSTEKSVRHRLDDGLFKQLTGEDVVMAEVKYGKPVTFRNRSRFVFLSNQVTLSDDVSHGFKRRMKFFHFMPLAAVERDFFEKYLKVELPGILNWAVRGGELYEKDGGFLRTQSDEVLLRETVELSDPVSQFWSEYEIADYVQTQTRRSRLFIDTDAVFPDFKEWRTARQLKLVSSAEFKEKTRLFLRSHPVVTFLHSESIHIPGIKANRRVLIVEKKATPVSQSVQAPPPAAANQTGILPGAQALPSPGKTDMPPEDPERTVPAENISVSAAKPDGSAPYNSQAEGQ